jgi:hypothetical protein
LTVWAFGDIAKAHGQFLYYSGITEMPVSVVNSDYINKQDKAFLRLIWFNRLVAGKSGLGCDYNEFRGRARGVKVKEVLGGQA